MQLNDDFNRFIEGNFELVGVCANRTIVFVALNFEFPKMGLVYEMKIHGGTSFENDIATEMLKPSSDKRMNWYTEEFQIKSISSSGDENAVMLRTDNTNMGCVYFKIKNEWRRCPVTSLGREQNILEITCDQNHCTAVTDTRQMFMCEWPTTGVSPLWQPKGNKSHLRTDVDFNNWYKTVGTPMSSNFGMTGTFGNPYLLNMNTDGEYLELVKNFHNEKLERHIAENKELAQRRKNEYKNMQLQKNENMKTIQNLEEQIENHQAQAEHHERTVSNAHSELQAAEEQLKQAQMLRDSLHQKHQNAIASHEQHKHELKALEHTINSEQRKMMNIHDVDSPTFSKSTLSTSDGGTNKSIIASNARERHSSQSRRVSNTTSQSNNRGQGRLLGFFSKPKATKAETQLDLKDIAHFSASRERRCTYI